MKTYNLLLIFLFAVIPFTVQAFDISEEFSKTIQKEYPVNTGHVLEINNKYGDVHIQNGESSVFKIMVKITVDVKDKQQAQELLNMLNVDFSQEGNKIIANTKIADEFGRSNNWMGMTNGKRFTIDYTVTMPKTNALTIHNKYGNIFIDEIYNLVDIDLKYGDMNINKLTRGDEKPMNQIQLAYGKLNILDCNWLKLQVSYSKINIEKSKALILLSKYSKGDLGKSSSLVGDNSYDTYQIGDVSNFVIAGKYSNFQINSISKKADINVKYTDVQVNFIPKKFESIAVNNQYGKVSLGIENGASYYLDAIAKYTNIEYPKENSRLNRISENNKLSLHGTVGQDPKATVNIITEYGGVKLIP